MSKTVIDTEVIRNSVRRLRKLNTDYKTKVKSNKKTTSKNDVGKTHDSIDRACELMDKEWEALFDLVENSIAFLKGTATSYDSNDKNSAISLK